MTAEWYSEDELRALLLGPENEFVDRKRGFDAQGQSVLRTLCAFANDYPERGRPGVVFIGADDKDGRPIAQTVDEELLNQLAGLRESPRFTPHRWSCIPPVSIATTGRLLPCR